MLGRRFLLALACFMTIGVTCVPPSALAVDANGGNAAADAGQPPSEDSDARDKSLHPVDWAVIAGYFALLLGIAWWVIRKSKDTADDYFLAGRNLGWFIVGASIFSSNIGSEHLVGLAGSGCTDGVAMAHYELHAWCLLVLAWVLVPFYARSMVYTMPEFLEKRFSATARWVLSIISLVAYVLTKIAVGIFAGGIVFRTLLPEMELDLGFVVFDSFWVGSFLVIILTGIYTVLGGLRAVAYTEAAQTLILVFGSVLVTIFGLMELAGDSDDPRKGWAELRKASFEDEETLAEEGNDRFDLWKGLVPKNAKGTWEPALERDDRGNVTRQAWYFKGGNSYPWLGMLFCAPIIGLWYWCTDQYIVQRALGAPNERVARRGSIFASFLKLLPVFIFIIPGMIAFALWKDNQLGDLAVQTRAVVDENGVAVIDENGVKKQERYAEVKLYDPEAKKFKKREITEEQLNDMHDSDDPELKNVVLSGNQAFPLLVQSVLPRGVRGIVVAGLLSALMSSLAGVFNASSTLFTMDLYQKFRPGASQHQLVWTGRVATSIMVLIGLAWVPVIKNAHGLYDYLQSVQSYLAPPIFVVFFFGVFIKRLNAKGCLAALIVGFALGVFRLVVDTPVALLAAYKDGYDPGSPWWFVNNVYFQYYSLFIFVVCIIVMIVVSYLTKAPELERIKGLTYGTVTDEHRRESRSSWDWRDVVASAVVLLAILAAYLYFTG